MRSIGAASVDLEMMPKIMPESFIKQRSACSEEDVKSLWGQAKSMWGLRRGYLTAKSKRHQGNGFRRPIVGVVHLRPTRLRAMGLQWDHRAADYSHEVLLLGA